jgi:hypothetical protein
MRLHLVLRRGFGLGKNALNMRITLKTKTVPAEEFLSLIDIVNRKDRLHSLTCSPGCGNFRELASIGVFGKMSRHDDLSIITQHPSSWEP